MENEDAKNQFIWGTWIVQSDSGDETKPIEEIYAAPEVKIESEAERTERLWLAIKEFSGG